MLPGGWSVAATPAASVIVAFAVVILLIRHGFHRTRGGGLERRRLASIVVLSASTYTFLVLVLSQLVIHGPPISLLIHDGFGEARVGWLLLGVALDGVFRVWDEFRQA